VGCRFGRQGLKSREFTCGMQDLQTHSSNLLASPGTKKFDGRRLSTNCARVRRGALQEGKEPILAMTELLDPAETVVPSLKTLDLNSMTLHSFPATLAPALQVGILLSSMARPPRNVGRKRTNGGIPQREGGNMTKGVKCLPQGLESQGRTWR